MRSYLKSYQKLLFTEILLFAAVDSIDLNILRKGWERAAASVPQAPSFDEAFKKMLNGIKEKLL